MIFANILSTVTSTDNTFFTLLDDILVVIGAISLVVAIIRFIWVFFNSNVEWIENVEIQVYDYRPDVDYEEESAFENQAVYPLFYRDFDETNGEEITVNYFIPKNAIIRKMKIKKVVEDSIPSGKEKYKTVKVVRNITPTSPLCMIVERREAIPAYLLEWKTQYGGKTSYYFFSNLRNSKYNKTGIEYSYGLWARIRKFFGLI